MRITSDQNLLAFTFVVGLLAISTAAELKESSIRRSARVALGAGTFALMSKVQKDLADDQRDLQQILADDSIRSAVIDSEARCQSAYYSLYPEKYRAGKPVPEEWRIQFHQTLEQGCEVQATNTLEGYSNPSLMSPVNARDGYTDLYANVTPNSDYMENLINPSVLLVFGGDGSGKTSFANEVVRLRLAASHTCIALDPHGAPNNWKGCKVIGHGLNFKAVEAEIEKMQSLVKHRYELIGSGEVKACDFPPVTFICEELTDWASDVRNAAELLKKAGNYRKVNVCLLLISHGDKLNQLGGSGLNGFATLIHTIVTKVNLFSKPGRNGKPVPALKGQIKYAGEDTYTPITVKERSLEAPTTHETHQTSQSSAQHLTKPSEPPERSNRIPSTITGSSGASTHKSSEPSKPFNTQEVHYLRVIQQYLEAGKSKAFIIAAIWDVTEADGGRYLVAHEFYERLLTKLTNI